MSLLDLLHPRLCCACGTPLTACEQWLCAECVVMLSQSRHPADWQDSVRLSRLGTHEAMRHAGAFTTYQRYGRVAAIVHSLKYRRRQELGVWLGRMAACTLRDSGLFRGVDVLVPLPLTPSRRRQRGFNQAEAIAAGMSRELGIGMRTDVLCRVRDTTTQTLFTGEDRISNVEGAFALMPGACVGGCHVMLVDDVLTTGATMTAAIKPLLAVPDVAISCFVLACTA